MSQKMGEKNVSTDWRMELHTLQREHNITKNILAEKVSQIKRQDENIKVIRKQLMLIKFVVMIIGFGVICADLAYERIAELFELQVSSGWGWQQWVVFMFGALLVVIGGQRD